MNLIKNVKSLNLPLGQYIIAGSGALEALGLREAQDIDVAVIPNLYKKLRESGEWKEETHYGKVFLFKEGVTVFPTLDWEDFPVTAEEAIAAALMIEGVPFLNLKHLRQFKKALGREKDFKDIELIDEHERRRTQNPA